MKQKQILRRKQLKNVAYGIAGRFSSRNNDIDGYWALGILYDAAAAAATNGIRLDLISCRVEPLFNHASRLLSQFNHYMQVRLEQVDLVGCVVAATIDIQFNVKPNPKYLICRTTWGEPFRCCVELTDDLGHKRMAIVLGYCGKHDVTKEHRSSRAYAS